MKLFGHLTADLLVERAVGVVCEHLVLAAQHRHGFLDVLRHGGVGRLRLEREVAEQVDELRALAAVARHVAPQRPQLLHQRRLLLARAAPTPHNTSV